jgi:MarR family 2-MHQ and catechol resistance regulon transcriptional repressor
VASLSQNAAELRRLVDDFIMRFRKKGDAIPNCPHADLSIQEVRVIERLGDSGPQMMRELAEYLPLAVNSVTSLVDNLEKRSIVRRNRSENDRRVVHVELTPNGQQMYGAAVEEKLSLVKMMLGALNREEQERFMELFRKIAKAE